MLGPLSMGHKMILSVSMLAASVSAGFVVSKQPQVDGYKAYQHLKESNPFQYVQVSEARFEVHESSETNVHLSVEDCAKKCTDYGTRCNAVHLAWTMLFGPAPEDDGSGTVIAHEPMINDICELYKLTDAEAERLKALDTNLVQPVPATERIALPAFLLKDPWPRAPLQDQVPSASDANQMESDAKKQEKKNSAAGKGLTLACVLGFLL